MRASVIAAFIVGLFLGAVGLYGALWYGGDIRWPLVLFKQRATLTPPPEDTSLPVMSKAPQQPPLVPPPSALPQTVAPQGEADRSMPAEFPDHPIIPISGVSTSQLTDSFNDTRDGHKHGAVDIPAAKETPVLAAVEGNVAKLFTSNQGGITVYQFDDSQQYCYYYAHLDRYAPGLKEGMLLRQGQALGFVGSTGDAQAAGPHLHFTIFRLGPDKSWWKGTAIDPVPLLR